MDPIQETPQKGPEGLAYIGYGRDGKARVFLDHLTPPMFNAAEGKFIPERVDGIENDYWVDAPAYDDVAVAGCLFCLDCVQGEFEEAKPTFEEVVNFETTGPAPDEETREQRLAALARVTIKLERVAGECDCDDEAAGLLGIISSLLEDNLNLQDSPIANFQRVVAELDKILENK